MALEYVLGFSFGWSIFQALFMRGMAGGSYGRSLTSTFFPELLSMNCLMAGMVPTKTLAQKSVPAGRDPSEPAFWFIMFMALLVGFITAYPMNWWLVSHHLKHGMMTMDSSHEPVSGGADKTPHDNETASGHTGAGQSENKPTMDDDAKKVSTRVLTWMTILSCVIFGLGVSIAIMFGGI